MPQALQRNAATMWRRHGQVQRPLAICDRSPRQRLGRGPRRCMMRTWSDLCRTLNPGISATHPRNFDGDAWAAPFSGSGERLEAAEGFPLFLSQGTPFVLHWRPVGCQSGECSFPVPIPAPVGVAQTILRSASLRARSPGLAWVLGQELELRGPRRSGHILLLGAVAATPR